MAQPRGRHRRSQRAKHATWALRSVVGTALGVVAIAGAAPGASAANNANAPRARSALAGFSSANSSANLHAQLNAMLVSHGRAAPAPAAGYVPKHEPVNFAAYPATREGMLSAFLFTGHMAEYDHRSVSAGIADMQGIPVPEGFRPVAPTEHDHAAHNHG